MLPNRLTAAYNDEFTLPPNPEDSLTRLHAAGWSIGHVATAWKWLARHL